MQIDIYKTSPQTLKFTGKKNIEKLIFLHFIKSKNSILFLNNTFFQVISKLNLLKPKSNVQFQFKNGIDLFKKINLVKVQIKKHQ